MTISSNEIESLNPGGDGLAGAVRRTILRWGDMVIESVER